jgi:hypothetical protein
MQILHNNLSDATVSNGRGSIAYVAESFPTPFIPFPPAQSFLLPLLLPFAFVELPFFNNSSDGLLPIAFSDAEPCGDPLQVVPPAPACTYRAAWC